ncbi:hypothetical protein STXM2123_5645 [Streptomyces sp. F-3]|nr:hypothetical protein STXM2123_5645 [Streptomyces sp. F-3]
MCSSRFTAVHRARAGRETRGVPPGPCAHRPRGRRGRMTPPGDVRSG